MEAYYYNQMNKHQQNAYYAMKAGLSALQPTIVVPRLSGAELQDIFFKLRLDCPEIFYAVTFGYRYQENASNVEMIPEYLFDKKKIKEHQSAMAARLNKLIRPAIPLNELEKEQYIHDFICTNVRYDKLKKPYSHEIIGPLGQGVGVCEGIAKTVKALCDQLGIWCIIVVSENNPDKAIKYRHAWNVVKIAGQYYHLDATFDNTLGHDGMIRYDYFNVDDQSIFRDHEPALYPVPPCTESKHTYYQNKKLSFTKIEEVSKRAEQAIRKGKQLIFHWRGGHLTREVLNELIIVLEQRARAKSKHAKIHLNWPQAILSVSFTDQEASKELVIEEANEGERG